MGSIRSFNLYNNNSSDVYSYLLDCSKAFDRIRHDKLLQKLISTGHPPVITRSLMHIYVNSQTQTQTQKVFYSTLIIHNDLKKKTHVNHNNILG